MATGDTVLVTGGSGFVAGWVIAEALNAGHPVRATMRTVGRDAQVRDAVSRVSDHVDQLSFVNAELGADDGWADAVEGCRYVLHVASPFPPTQPKDPDELIVPARDGAIRVVGAALDAGVERIVLTSSIASIDFASGESHDRKLTPEDWTDGDSPRFSPYARSKALAEKAAWELARERGMPERLVSVNPGAILGPVLHPDHSFSLQLIERLLDGERAIPKLGYNVVDVRDLAVLELAAMTSAAAGGERLIATAEFTWMTEIAEILRDRLGSDASKVPTRNAPDFLVKLIGRFDGSVKSIVPLLGVKTEYANDLPRELLGWRPRPVEETVVDCARSLLAE